MVLARQGWQQQINLLAAGILTRRAIFPRLTAQTRPGGKFNARKGGGAVQGEESAGEPPMKTDSLTDRPPRNRFGRAILTNMLEKNPMQRWRASSSPFDLLPPPPLT